MLSALPIAIRINTQFKSDFTPRTSDFRPPTSDFSLLHQDQSKYRVIHDIQVVGIDPFAH